MSEHDKPYDWDDDDDAEYDILDDDASAPSATPASAYVDIDDHGRNHDHDVVFNDDGSVGINWLGDYYFSTAAHDHVIGWRHADEPHYHHRSAQGTSGRRPSAGRSTDPAEEGSQGEDEAT